MTVIKNLAFLNKSKLKKLSSFVASELDLSAFYAFPIDFLHYFLPFKFKFLDESFVAIDNKKIKGLITVNKANSTRLKITRLLLEENSAEIGKLLVDCVMTLFLSKGAESFYVVVNKENAPLNSMFQNAAGFQNYAKEIIYGIKNTDSILGFDETNFDHIKKMNFSEIKPVCDLINNSMQSYRRPTFYKKTSDLRKNFFFQIEQYVVFDRAKNLILGYFTIQKLKNTDYLLDFVMEKGFEGYVVDITKFAWARLMKKKKFKNLFIKLKSYYSNFSDLAEILNIEYEKISENNILVKDFLVAKKQEFKYYEKMIFNDVTPAF